MPEKRRTEKFPPTIIFHYPNWPYSPFFPFYLHLNLVILQRVVQEAVAQVMTGDLPLMQPMALLVEVVRWDPDPMVTVGLIVILPKMVTLTLAQTLAAVKHLTDYHRLHLVFQVTNENRWLIDDRLTIHILSYMHFWRVSTLTAVHTWEDMNIFLFLRRYLGDEMFVYIGTIV